MGKRGFTLIEVITAVFLLTVGAVGVFALVNQAISSTSVLKNRLIAAYLAQEGIEIMRNIRDTNWLEDDVWDDGFTGNPCGTDYTKSSCPPGFEDDNLQINTTTGFYDYSAGTPTVFQRSIAIDKSVADRLAVTVTVSWTGRGGAQNSFTAVEHLYNWR